MFDNLSDYMRKMSADAGARRRAVFDSAAAEPSRDVGAAKAVAKADFSLRAAGLVQQWAETEPDDLDEDETLADRLLMLCVGAVDENKDGELTKDEQDAVELVQSSVWDYLASCGVDEDDADALINDLDEEAAERVRDLLVSDLPDGDDAIEDMEDFAFSDEEQGTAFDSAGNSCGLHAIFDATYKKVYAVRNGKKVRINKRVSGKVRLSAKQKVALRKARMKSHSAKALMKRVRSLKVRRRAGL